MVNDKDTIDEIIKAIDEYFADPKNVEKFKKYLESELTKPYMTNLQCNCCWCIYIMSLETQIWELSLIVVNIKIQKKINIFVNRGSGIYEEYNFKRNV